MILSSFNGYKLATYTEQKSLCCQKINKAYCETEKLVSSGFEGLLALFLFLRGVFMISLIFYVLFKCLVAFIVFTFLVVVTKLVIDFIEKRFRKDV